MLDIGKSMANDRPSMADPDGNMFDLGSWSPHLAQRRAAEEGLFLSEEHWEVIFFLRERHRSRGIAASAREVTRELEVKFADGQGRRHLYELFPGGPVAQGSRIAGLPLPPYSTDPSFGSVR
jgi:tRNA 2-thiouridine synthesizing protein E